MNPTIQSHKDLIVWQRAMELVIAIYTLTSRFPSTEIYNLTSQMKRVAISIPSNIAEGRRRSTRKDYRLFLVHAYASGAELETQLEIAKRLKFSTEIDYTDSDRLLNEVMRMLNSMLGSLRTYKLPATT